MVVRLEDLDRQDVEDGGLRAFFQLAWPIVEPRALRWNWHLDAICEHLQACIEGEIQKLLIAVPPSCSKTLSASVMAPAWSWTKDPALKWITATYGQQLSNKSARQHRAIVQSPWFRDRWGDTCEIKKDNERRVQMFETSAGGFRFSTSTMGEVTGRHADILLADDLIKAQDANTASAIEPKKIEAANYFWESVIPTRRADPETTREIMIMQRLHVNDPAARAMERGYVALVLPMEYDPRRQCVTPLGFKDPRKTSGDLLWGKRFTPAVVAELKESLGPMTASAQLQQNPTPAEGRVFKRSQFKYWGKGQDFRDIPHGAIWLISVDTTFKGTQTSDRVALGVWAQKGANAFLVDARFGHWDFNETIDQIKRAAEDYPDAYSKLIEDSANGPAIASSIGNEISGIELVPTKGASKESRAWAITPALRAGNVYLPKHADWLEEYITELTNFPNGRFDDLVDMTSQAIMRLLFDGTGDWLAAMQGVI